MKNRFFGSLVLMVVLILASCSTTRYPGTDYPDDRNGYPEEKGGKGGDSYSFNALGIPKGHLPLRVSAKFGYPDGNPASKVHRSPAHQRCVMHQWVPG